MPPPALAQPIGGWYATQTVRRGLLTLFILMMVPASVRGGSGELAHERPEPRPVSSVSTAPQGSPISTAPQGSPISTARQGSPISTARQGSPISTGSPIGSDCRQLLLVRAGSWTAATGTLERYERTEGSTWTPIGAAIPVDIGRNGMAWGRGLQVTTEAGPVKREGDGKSPAGVYRLGTAFGLAPSLPTDARGFPYTRTLPTNYCVEDARSTYYNQIVDSTRVRPPSLEQWSQMARADGLFDWGVVVQQNAPEIQKGAGSCVFLHIWRGPKKPTAGCTAMAPDHIQETLRWLDPDRGPLLVQLPEPIFRDVRAAWGLPQG